MELLSEAQNERVEIGGEVLDVERRARESVLEHRGAKLAHRIGPGDWIAEEPPYRLRVEGAGGRVFASDDEVAQHDEQRWPSLGRMIAHQLEHLWLDAEQERITVRREERPFANHPVELVVVAGERRERVVGPVDEEAGDDRRGARGRGRGGDRRWHHGIPEWRRRLVAAHRRGQLPSVGETWPVSVRRRGLASDAR